MLVLAVVAIVLIAIGIADCGPDKDLYVARNEQIIASLPYLDESELIGSDDAGYGRDEEDTSTVGWQSIRNYLPPPGMSSAQTVNVLIDELSEEWRLCERQEKSGTLERDGSQISIGVTNDSIDERGFRVIVDHDASYLRCTAD